MINELNEKLKGYSNKYFIDKFINSKPNAEYNKLKHKGGVAIVVFYVLWLAFSFSIMFQAYCWVKWWYPLIVFLGLFIDVCWFWRLDCRRAGILSKMASVYVKTHIFMEWRLPAYGSLKTKKAQDKYIYSIRNSYRAEVVRRYMGAEYNIRAIKDLKDEVEIKNINLWGLISYGTFLSLSIEISECMGYEGVDKLYMAFGFSLIWLTGCVAVWFGISTWLYCRNKHKILRETLEFILYDQCKR